MPTVVFHLGLHKTGTTAFQKAMASARDRLASQGIIYPKRRFNHSNDLYTMFGKKADTFLPNVLAGRTGPGLEAYRAECFDAWTEIFETAPPESQIIVSGEDLSRFDGEEWKALVGFFGPRVSSLRALAVVREPISWSTSSLQQAVKGGESLWSPKLNVPLQLVKKRMGALLEALPASDVTVLRYEDLVASQHGLVPALAEAAGVPAPLAASLGSPQSNSALSAAGAALLSAVNEKLPLREYGPVGADRTQADFKAFNAVEGPRLRLTKKQQRRVINQWAQDQEFLQETFGLTATPEIAETVEEHSPIVQGHDVLSAVGAQMVKGFLHERALRKARHRIAALEKGRDRQRLLMIAQAVGIAVLLVLLLLSWIT